mmetsp:Transcript_78494/g.217960  ORF Transcript_78494/g.217960 Transcript_78494/m.217960 type:complete len:244 (-) Transcript_78494:182-913(-)
MTNALTLQSYNFAMPRANNILWPAFVTRTVSQNDGSTTPRMPNFSPPSTFAAAICAKSASNSVANTSKYCTMAPTPSSKPSNQPRSSEARALSYRGRLAPAAPPLEGPTPPLEGPKPGNLGLGAGGPVFKRPLAAADGVGRGGMAPAEPRGRGGAEKADGPRGPPWIPGGRGCAVEGVAVVRGPSTLVTVNPGSTCPLWSTTQPLIGGRALPSVPALCAQTSSPPTSGPNHQPQFASPSLWSQ